jgi:23S rRNA pseudouridine2605 synthase
VELDKILKASDLEKIRQGVELEDGPVKVDEVSYIADAPKREVGITLHSGRNRIVRRIFEHLGYEVVKLDRVVFAGLTKKDLPRGHWRHLTPQEVINLKMIS